MKTWMEWIDANMSDAMLLLLFLVVLCAVVAIDRHMALIERRSRDVHQNRRGFNRAYL